MLARIWRGKPRYDIGGAAIMGNRKCLTMFRMPLQYNRLLSLYPGSGVGMSKRYLHLQAPCTVKEKT